MCCQRSPLKAVEEGNQSHEPLSQPVVLPVWMGEAWGTRGWGVGKGRWQEEAKLRRLSQAGHGMCK